MLDYPREARADGDFLSEGHPGPITVQLNDSLSFSEFPTSARRPTVPCPSTLSSALRIISLVRSPHRRSVPGDGGTKAKSSRRQEAAPRPAVRSQHLFRYLPRILTPKAPPPRRHSRSRRTAAPTPSRPPPATQALPPARAAASTRPLRG